MATEAATEEQAAQFISNELKQVGLRLVELNQKIEELTLEIRRLDREP